MMLIKNITLHELYINRIKFTIYGILVPFVAFVVGSHTPHLRIRAISL